MDSDNRKAKVTPGNVEESRLLRGYWNSTPEKPNQAVFGERFEIGSQSAVTQFLNGRSPLSLKAAQGFAKGLQCDIAAFSPRLAALAHGIAASVTTSSEPVNIAPAAIGRNRIPLIDYVQAGMWTEVSNPYEAGDGSEFLLTDLELSASAFALEIKGNSMAPEFNPGDRVIIDPDVAPQAGDYVVAKNGGEEATFKKYRLRGHNDQGDEVFELIPLNEDYAPMRSDQQPIQIVGTMVEHRKYRRKR